MVQRRTIRHWRLVSLLLLLAFVSVTAMGCGGNQEQTAQPKTESTSQPPSKEQPKQETQKPEWREVKSWSGTGIKTTETFQITGKEWRINWTAKNEQVAGVLQIFVYDKNNNLVALAANQQGEGSDVSYVREKPGSYYLTINSANVKWTVKVEELR